MPKVKPTLLPLVDKDGKHTLTRLKVWDAIIQWHPDVQLSGGKPGIVAKVALGTIFMPDDSVRTFKRWEETANSPYHFASWFTLQALTEEWVRYDSFEQMMLGLGLQKLTVSLKNLTVSE
jgi:hypothetical protein